MFIYFIGTKKNPCGGGGGGRKERGGGSFQGVERNNLLYRHREC